MKQISIIRTIFALFIFGVTICLFDYNTKWASIQFAVAMSVLAGLFVVMSAFDMIKHRTKRFSL